MRDVYEVRMQRTVGAYKTVQLFFRERDALDYLKSIAFMHPEYPYDGVSWNYDVGADKHDKTRYRIVKNGVSGSPEEKRLTSLKKSIKI